MPALNFLISKATRPSRTHDEKMIKRSMVAAIVEQICGTHVNLEGEQSTRKVPVRVTQLPLLCNLLTFSEHKLNLPNIKRYLKASADHVVTYFISQKCEHRRFFCHFSNILPYLLLYN